MKPIVFYSHSFNLKSRLKIFTHISIVFLFICTAVNAQVKVIAKITIQSFNNEMGGSIFAGSSIGAYSTKNSIFKILPNELKVKDIPVCLVMTLGKQEYKFALTDSNGEVEFKLSPDPGTTLWISANARSEECGNAIKYFRPEYTTYSKNFIEREVSIKILERKGTINVNCNLFYSGQLLETMNMVNKLIPQLSDLDFEQINSKIENIMGAKTFIGSQYPKSSELTRTRLLGTFEETRKKVADNAFKQKDYYLALKIYDDLLDNFPNSSAFNRTQERRDSCKIFVQNKIVCDSLMKIGNNISNNLTALEFFRSSLTNISSDNDCYYQIHAVIANIESAIESEKEKAEYDKRISNCKAILKRYNIDLSVTQVDIFANPFAYIGKYTALTCIVDRFETPTSAIMQAAKTFYADFQITPPKKVSTLDVIARVKGVKELINAYGAPVKVPYLEIVHILDCSISELNY